MMAYLSMGPVFFNWGPARWRDFYFRIAEEAPVDTVYLGEAVCAKRIPFIAPNMETVIQRLRAAGKRVAISSLALIGNEREVASMHELCASSELVVEANDVGLVRALAGRPHILGPLINIYNESTLAYLTAQGAERACLPPELPAASIRRLAVNASIPLEVLAFGRLPLAISARCFHARAHQLHKDGCQFVCAHDPNGLVVETLDGEPFLAINGLQVLSCSCCNLLGELETLRDAGIAGFRLSPMAADMAAVARTFRDVLDRKMDAEEATKRIADLVPNMRFSNGFLYGREGRSLNRAGLLDAE